MDDSLFYRLFGGDEGEGRISSRRPAGNICNKLNYHKQSTENALNCISFSSLIVYTSRDIVDTLFQVDLVIVDISPKKDQETPSVVARYLPKKCIQSPA